jgi:hypothetical protein
VHSGTVTLFKPADAIRVRSASFTGTPMPKDEPMAPNPPDGAIIDYVLPAAVTGPVEVTIRDASNQVVRSYSSADHVPAPDAATLQFAPEWVPPAPIPAAAAGMQRFVWDLRYATPARDDGVWAPPGQYTVQLTVAGRDYRQALTVKPDPRINLPEGAYQREFDLARKVEVAKLQASTALARAVTLLDALDGRLASAGAAHRQMAALLAKASSISGTTPHAIPFPAVPSLRTDSLQALAMDLDTLESAVDDADADPSPDALSSYAILSQKLAGTIAEWTRLETVEVPKLNARLKAAGGRPI